MSKKGKTPSLLSGSAGSCEFHEVKAKSHCKRCHCDVSKGQFLVRVKIPGTVNGYKAYCSECFSEVLNQSEKDLSRLRADLQQWRQDLVVR